MIIKYSSPYLHNYEKHPEFAWLKKYKTDPKIKAFIVASQQTAVAQLKKGQTIEFMGTINRFNNRSLDNIDTHRMGGLSEMVDIDIINCELV